jgi:hypothetical protein
MSSGWTPALVLRNVLAFAANMAQIYGVLHGQWDTFQILMLYWMETAVIGFWGLMRLAVLPAGLLGEMTVNGSVIAATNKLILAVFGPFVVISLAAHFLFLWAMFSGPWAKIVHGPISFASEFIVESGAWGPLGFTLLAGAVGFYQSPKRSTFLPRLRGLFASRPAIVAVPPRGDAVAAAIGGTLGRIVLMQVAVILGGMLVRSYGNIMPWLILTGLKTLMDFHRPHRGARPASGAVLSDGRNSIGV